MGMRAFATLLACLIALVALPGSALAGKRHAPPGNSSVDEYSESVPGPDGDRPVPREGPVFPGPSGPVGGAAGSRALRSLGADGRAVERFASHTGPRSALAGRGSRTLPAADGRSLPEQILDALTGSGQGGMGAMLPLLLLAAAVATLLVARRRRRESATTS
jgi:hypothetical protein